MYVPTLARFTARDPIAANAPMVLYSRSPYAYALNQPLRFVDPSGLQEEDELGPLDPPPPPLPEDAPTPIYPVDPLPAGHETWDCKPHRDSIDRISFEIETREYRVFLDTCCEVKVRLGVRGTRCFRPGTVEQREDTADAQNFYTEIYINKRVIPISADCPEEFRTNVLACRIFPGRYLTRLEVDFPEIMPWPGPESDTMSDLDIDEAACDAVRRTLPGKA